MLGSTLVLLFLLQSPDSWTPAPAPSPGPTNLAYTVERNRLWLMGGRNQPGSDDRHMLREFTAAGGWAAHESIDVPDAGYFNPCGAALNGFLYQIGGVERNWDGTAWVAGPFTPHVWRYSIDDKSWTRVADLPIALNFGRAVATRDRIVVLGGRTYDASGTAVHSAAVFSYDPGADTWSTLPDLPSPVHSGHVAWLEGSIYYAGGNVGGTPVSTAWKLPLGSLASGWVPVADLPSPRAFAGYSVAAGRLYVTGGASVLPAQQHVEYSPAADRWVVRTPPGITVHHGFAGALTEGPQEFIHAGGGTLATYSMMKYALPDFGKAPTLSPASLSDPAGMPIAEGARLGVGIVKVSARIDDAEAGSGVLLQARASTDPGNFPEGAWVSGPTVPAGQAASVDVTVAGSGAWFVEVRGVDTHGNASAWTPVGDPAQPDFVVDADPPTPAAPVSPVDLDYEVPDKGGGPVTFTWSASMDAGPVSYRVEVSRASTFLPLVGAQNATTESTSMWLAAGAQDYYWRVVAIDDLGHAAAGPSAKFRVVKADGPKHDYTGCSASARTGSSAAALLGLLATLAITLRPGRA